MSGSAPTKPGETFGARIRKPKARCMLVRHRVIMRAARPIGCIANPDTLP